jgi:hypothetical protein
VQGRGAEMRQARPMIVKAGRKLGHSRRLKTRPPRRLRTDPPRTTLTSSRARSSSRHRTELERRRGRPSRSRLCPSMITGSG